MCTFFIGRVKRDRIGRGLILYPCKYQGQNEQCGKRRCDQAADNSPAERRRLISAFPKTRSHRDHTHYHGHAGHQDRTHTNGCRFPRGVQRIAGSHTNIFGVGYQQHRVGYRYPYGHDHTHIGFRLRVDPVIINKASEPSSTAGTVHKVTNDTLKDWKFAASMRKITTIATSRPV